MGEVISFHPLKSALILLYEVVDESGNAEWGGASAKEALIWFRKSYTSERVLVSGWDSDDEDAHLVGQPLDITPIITETIFQLMESLKR